MTDRYQLVPASYVFLLRGDGDQAEVLLQRRANTGVPGQPLGGRRGQSSRRGQEDPYTAAIREAREELAIRSTDTRPADGDAPHRTHPARRSTSEVDFFFACRRWSGTARRRDRLPKTAGLGCGSRSARCPSRRCRERRAGRRCDGGPPAICGFRMTGLLHGSTSCISIVTSGVVVGRVHGPVQHPKVDLQPVVVAAHASGAKLTVTRQEPLPELNGRGRAGEPSRTRTKCHLMWSSGTDAASRDHAAPPPAARSRAETVQPPCGEADSINRSTDSGARNDRPNRTAGSSPGTSR
ncbi:NUDIX domain-containing protein [Pseudonocardia sp. MCCB 268]|nr:NUDIX domain-containing protein [Pseudonocardia cytotoxica]